VWILNRSAAPAQKLARQAKARSIKRADLKKMAFDVIINATPVGMIGAESPLKDSEIQARVVFDMVYDPVETPLIRMARAKGLSVIPGVEMFVHQAARQFEIWTGKPAPADDMLRAVTITLQERAATRGREKGSAKID
jgi:3-dehydroquinate dehydratase/shikimate dehydrogenase